MRRLAYGKRAFWETHAPFASGTLLFKQYPPTQGGLVAMGWRHQIAKAKDRWPELAWGVFPRGRSVIAPDVWPEPIYEGKPPPGEPRPEEPEPEPDYGVTLEMLSDGSQRSDRLVRMSEQDAKSPAFLLEAHGFDPAEWELVTAKNNIWNVYSKNEAGDGHDVSTLYASRITVKPLTNRFEIEAVLAALRTMEPVHITPVSTGNGLLEVPFFDLHKGVAPDGCYDMTASRTVAQIRKGWNEVVFPIGSDLFHNDNFQGTTVKGTVVDKMDFPKAWTQAFSFYYTLINVALECSKNVYIYYSPGNHDASMSWAFCHLLQSTFPQLICDLEIVERKVHRYHDVCVGWTHGDKAVKDFDRIFNSEFPEFGTAPIREIHIGHKHHEFVKDVFGTMVRGLPTGNPPDGYHRDNGWVGANRRFQLFLYSEDALVDICYV